ncbi:hypothetical protein N7488_006111 [Penicillium malachiteum]|nr:hypothetical protein N7488_006111 [Penicillium malachiteum]
MEYSRLSLLPIPATIRRRLPRLYSTQRPVSDNDSSGVERLRHGLTSLSEPQLCHRQFPELVIIETQRPSTASDSLDSFESGSVGTESPPTEEGMSPAKYETESGLRWNRVIPAFNLLRNAGYEAQQPYADGRLTRSLYINALMYLLDALPSDLTLEETTMLQNRLPESVKLSISSNLPSQPHPEGQTPTKAVPCHRSYLHRLLAFVIIQFFLLIRFLMPYLRILLRQLYEYERSHRITQRLVTTTLDAADGLGKKGFDIGTAVCRFNEGRVGMAVGNLLSWWVEGIAGGIYEGVGEGMMHLGLLKPGLELDRLTFQDDRL